MTRCSAVLFLAALLWLFSTTHQVVGQQQATAPEQRYAISGHVSDPLGIRPRDSVLMLAVAREGAGVSSVPVTVASDGSFITQPLPPASYVLQLVRAPHARTRPSTVIGFAVVRVDAADVPGVTVAVRRDTTLVGRLRMESDDPAARWPTHVAVSPLLTIDGAFFPDATASEGAPDGRFILRNAFGPRVLRCGYQLAPGHSWWPTRVLLDGVDITDVPTDFSMHEDGELEVVFSQHPAWFIGTVTDPEGAPARGAWVLVFSANRELWQSWASTSHAVTTDSRGVFRVTSLPGRYLLRALPPGTFSSRESALRQLAGFAAGGTIAELGDRESKRVALTLPAK